jgi:hypothetical protein
MYAYANRFSQLFRLMLLTLSVVVVCVLNHRVVAMPLKADAAAKGTKQVSKARDNEETVVFQKVQFEATQSLEIPSLDAVLLPVLFLFAGRPKNLTSLPKPVSPVGPSHISRLFRTCIQAQAP